MNSKSLELKDCYRKFKCQYRLQISKAKLAYNNRLMSGAIKQAYKILGNY